MLLSIEMMVNFVLHACMEFKEEKQSGKKYNRILDAVVTNIKYKKITIDNAIYIKVFSDVTVYYLSGSTDDVLNTTNNETSFPELTRVFEEHFEMKFQEGYVPMYPNLRMC